MCYFYILYSRNLDRYYIGHSCDSLENRLRQHLYEHGGFTGKAKDWKLVYQEAFPSKSVAYARERQVKRWKNRLLVERLIEEGT
ncbi:MAG: GIY-YIG nuclease family protein [Flavobacteriaceae bacterium]